MEDDDFQQKLLELLASPKAGNINMGLLSPTHHSGELNHAYSFGRWCAIVRPAWPSCAAFALVTPRTAQHARRGTAPHHHRDAALVYAQHQSCLPHTCHQHQQVCPCCLMLARWAALTSRDTSTQPDCNRPLLAPRTQASP